jgi:hypothetical protein
MIGCCFKSGLRRAHCKFLFTLVAFLGGLGLFTVGGTEKAAANANELSFDITGLRNLVNSEFRSCDTINCDFLKWLQDPNGKLWAQACNGYFDMKASRLGEFGVTLAHLLIDDLEGASKRLTLSPFFSNDVGGLVELCPNYPNLGPVDRIAVWQLVFQGLGFKESTCDPAKSNSQRNVPNPPAVGLYQLEERKALRNWRSPACAVESVRGVTENIECAFSILRTQLVKKRHLFGKAPGNPSRSYWHGLNNGNSVNQQIRAFVASNPACKVAP